MKTEQFQWSMEANAVPGRLGAAAQVVLVFGPAHLCQPCFSPLRQAYPSAHILGCSTSGEIQGTRVRDDTVAVTAIAFEHTAVATASIQIASPERSFRAGEELALSLDTKGLRHVLVLAEGVRIYGNELLGGLHSALAPGVTVFGGLAGDGNRWQNTFVWCDGEPRSSQAVALGFYGDRLHVSVAAAPSWGPLTPVRTITKSKKNILYELDGHPALLMYKRYMGRHVQGLPESLITFPIALDIGDSQYVMRAPILVNEQEQSIVFAGNMPEGSQARLLWGTIEDIIDGAQAATTKSLAGLMPASPEFALLVSCVGRRRVLQQRVEEEVEAVREILGERPAMAGFYSQGEFAPMVTGGEAEFCNETLTIASFAEV